MIIFHVLSFLSIAHAASFRGAVTGRSGTHDLPSEIGSPIFATGVDSFGANDSAKSGTVLEEDPTSSSSGPASVDSNEGLRRHRRLLALERVGNEGVPASAFPLGECQGECDSDEDCQGALICYERGERESVPGCSGNGRKGKDYCAFRPDNYLRYITKDIDPTTGSLGLCIGDCDLDEHCAEGYVCFYRDGYTPVPGCDGDGRRGTDYCIPGPTDSPTMSPTTKAPTTSPSTVAPTASPTTRAPTTRPSTVALTASPTTRAPTTLPSTVALTASPTTKCDLLSQTSSSDIPNTESIACAGGGGTTEQKWARCYALGEEGCSRSRTVDSVTFGVARVAGDGAVALKVNVWKDSGCLSGNPGTAGELVASIDTEASASDGLSLMTVDIDSDFQLAPSDAIRVEIEQTLDGRDFTPPKEFFPGTNGLGQTAPAYLLAPVCGLNSFASYTALGFASMHLILDVQTSLAD